MLPAATSRKVGPALASEKLPAATAATAKRNSSSEVMSFSRLSPWRITISRCGGLSWRRIEVAAAASGGATMAPSAMAAAQGRPGTMA